MKRILCFALFIAMCFPLMIFSSKAATAYTSHTKIANELMTLKNLSTNKAVQQIAFYNSDESRYVFVTQRVSSTLYLSRCLIANDGLSATCIDYITLEGYGHGESLAVSEYNNQVYVLLACDAVTDVADSLYTTYFWGRNVARFIYTPDASSKTGAKATDVKKLTDFTNASANGSALHSGGSVTRLVFSVSPNSDRIMFWLKIKNSSSTKQFLCCYTLSALHSALSASSGSVSMKNMNSHQLAQINYSGELPNDSMQGIGLDGSSTLYISGGSASQTPTVHKYSYTSSSCTLKEVWTVPSKANTEIESAYMLNDSFYCVLIDDTSADGKKNKTKIYTLDNFNIQQMQANHCHTIKNLPISNAVQNFAYTEDMSELYVSQSKGSDTYISRCIIKNDIAIAKDYIVLTGDGIGESLDIDQSVSGITYLWIGAAPLYNSYSTAYRRLCYIVDETSPTGASYTSVLVNDAVCASADGTVLDSTALKRSAVACTKGADNRIVFRTHFSSGDIYYTVYNTSQLNAAISAAGNNYSLKTATEYVKSNFMLAERPYGSFQGVEAHGVGTDAKFLHIIGGNGGDMQMPLIYKYLYTNGGNTSLSSAIRLPAISNTAQGIKQYGDTLYISVQPQNDCANQTVIRSLSISFVADPVIRDNFELSISGVTVTDTKKLSAPVSHAELVAMFDNTNELRVLDSQSTVSEFGAIGTGYTVQSLDYNGKVADEAKLIVCGDTNGDGQISSSDLGLVQLHLIKASPLSDCYLTAGDTNEDGVLSAVDYLSMTAILTQQ